MNKAELIDEVSKLAELTKADTAKAVDAVFQAIETALTKGDEVRLAGFGSFGVRESAARTARNPKTGVAVPVPATKRPTFKAGKGLKDAVN